jgi:hypothetical protein
MITASQTLRFSETKPAKPTRGKRGYAFNLVVNGVPVLTVSYPTMDQTEEAKQNMREALEDAIIIHQC